MNVRDYLRVAKNFALYYKYVYETRNADFFEYKKLAKPCIIYAGLTLKNGLLGNRCYGNWMAVMNALGDRYNPHCMIEHGIYFGERILFPECEMSEISTIYTYSPYRVKVLKDYYKGNLGKEVIAVGPYIKYAPNFHTEEELKAIKEKYGKILLVFPSHPDPSNDTVYDIKEFIAEIDRVAKDYDNVFVSMFWVDIKKEKYKIYQDKGYTIVCSGTRSDPRFLSRQKDLIELADMTMSNDNGTHIGFCIALNRPHYLYRQEVKLDLSTEDPDIIKDLERGKAAAKREYIEIQNAFSSSLPVITEEQRRIVTYYWGTVVEDAVKI